MKKICAVFVLVICVWSCQGQVRWQKTYGGNGYDNCRSVQQTSDGGYILCGSTLSYGEGGYDIYLIKTDSIGDTLWTKTCGTSNWELGMFVQQTFDNGFIVAAQIRDTVLYKYLLVKTDINGETLWTKTYTVGNDGASLNSVRQTSDSGYILIGSINQFDKDIYLLKTDLSGNVSWSRTFGISLYDSRAYSIQETNDSGYIIVGSTYDINLSQNYQDIYLIKTDLNGNLLWSKIYKGAAREEGEYVQQTNDGGYIINGYTNSFGAGGFDVFLIKINSVGDTLWSKTYGGLNDENGYTIRQTSDSGYAIIASSGGFGLGSGLYFIKTNSVGDTLFTKIYGVANSTGVSVSLTSDGGYILGGDKFGAISWDSYLVKIDVNGNSGCIETGTTTIMTSPSVQIIIPSTNETSPTTLIFIPSTIVSAGGTVTTLCSSVSTPELYTPLSEILLSPNPANEFVEISSDLEVKAITIYNLLGENVAAAAVHLRTEPVPLQAGNSSLPTKLDISALPTGMYFVKVTTDEGSAVKKFVKQ